jgi:formylglycine-generating enzyme required for sulfatase activity
MVHVDAPAGGRAYCIDTTEVTNAQYAAFLASAPSTATQPAPCTSNSDFTPGAWPRPADDADVPVTQVDWCDARAFCEWAGKRLCALTDGTTAGGESDERNTTRSEWAHVCAAGEVMDCSSDLVAVRSRPCCQSDGAYDLGGNAEEWTGTCSMMFGSAQCVTHDGTRCDSTRGRDQDTTRSELGFRCCADPT